MDEPVVVEVVGVDELPLGERASRRLVVRWSDGTVFEALRWYADEWLVSEGDLVGKTSAEIRALAHRRGVAYLQQDDDEEDGPPSMPFFDGSR